MNAIERIFEKLLIALVVSLVFSVLWQVISRYLFTMPAAWTEELARFLLIWIGMLGASYAYLRRSHIGLDILPQRLSGTAAVRLTVAIHCICGLFGVVVLIIGGGALMVMTWRLRQYSAAIGLPIALVYAVIPLSGVLISIFAVSHALGARDVVNARERWERGM